MKMPKERNRETAKRSSNRRGLAAALILIAAIAALSVVFYLDEVKDVEPYVHYEFDNDRIFAWKERQIWVKPKTKAHVEDVQERIPGIVCWGGSLTAGVGGYGTSYPALLAGLLAKNDYVTTTVINLGGAGESTREIRTRAGVFTLLLTEEVMIPAACEPVRVAFVASDKHEAKVLCQNPAGMSDVTINGIRGTLSFDSEEESYWFTRAAEGYTSKARAGTPIINEASYLYKDYLPIIWMGENGVWGDNPEELIRQQHEMIDTAGRNKDRFLVLGLSTGTAESRSALESAMEAHWGRQYVNLREGLCDEERIIAQGLTCSEEDLASIARGKVPAVVRHDAVHLTKQGYAIVAELVYERLVELGFVEK